MELLKIALELATDDPVCQDTAGKFFEHFLRIARAMTGDYRGGLSLWDEEDGLFTTPCICRTAVSSPSRSERWWA